MNRMRFEITKLFKFYHKIAFIFLISIFLKINSVYAQSHISGKIVNGKDSSVAGANVLLLYEKDSSLVKGIFSLNDGGFSFADIPDGMYLISSSFAGFKQVYSSAIHINGSQNIHIDKLVLIESFAEMNAVTVVSRRALYEQKP